MFDTITVVGVGLIGGSLSLSLKEKGLVKHVIGVGRTESNLKRALQLGLIDEALLLEEAVKKCDLIYVAIPVDATLSVMKKIMDTINHNQIVVDAGSTKNELCSALADHPMRKRFIASHPMWGTEHSGPDAAVHNAFNGRNCVICEKEKSEENALKTVERMYHAIGMHMLYMDPVIHDIRVAYISHISHITSFALANTVLEKEKEENAIFELASGGFESTVRLAKSNPAMWVPIFMQNRKNIMEVLNEHITQLQKFKQCLQNENQQCLQELIEGANEIKKILP